MGIERAENGLQYVVRIYSLLGFLSLAIFGALHVLVEGNPALGYLELASSILMVLNMAALKVTNNVNIARDLFLATLITMLIVMLATGGTAGTGIFWFFLFPVAAFFLTEDKRRGVYWVAGLLGLVVVLWLLRSMDLVYLWYSDIAIRQLLVSMAVVTIGIYAYQQSRESAHRLKRSVDQARSEFVTLASHQLRTPISAIRWFAEMLLHGDAGHMSKEQKDYVEQIYSSNQRMANLVDELLIVSSLELGTMPIRPEPIDAAAFCKQVVHEQKASAAEKGLTLREQYDESLDKLLLDPHILKNILRNILGNAIKYTSAGGSISLDVTATTRKLRPGSKGCLAIIINDSGYGISKGDQQRVFTKFFRGQNIRDKDTDGTGVGLYMVKMLLDYVGGAISFTSIENVGTTFVVELPLEGMQGDSVPRNI